VFIKIEDKEDGYPKKVKVNPTIVLDFKKDILLAITLKHESS
jgi:hypothetical protein